MGQARRAIRRSWTRLIFGFQVARHDPNAADRLIDRFSAVIGQLVGQPHLGRSVDHLLPGLRSLPVGNYLIFHRPDEDGVFIVRIIHGARHITPELFE